ncbi:MAG: hypothetical protein H0V44_18305 [Planctomycetes bacterium]|nr:hypothetical protein [Planctomycetota bacterium]
MGSSSRIRRPGAQKPAGRKAAPEPEVDDSIESELPGEDIDVSLPEGGATFAEEAYEATPQDGSDEAPVSSKSSRRGSSSRTSRSSRREDAKKSDKKSVRRPKYTPEEQAARRRGLLSAMKLALGLVLLVGVAFAAYWFLLRDDEKMLRAKALLADIEHQDIQSIKNDLKVQQPESAKKTMEAARKKLSDAPDLGRPDIIPLAEEVKTKLADLEQDIERVKRDVRVQTNLRDLHLRFKVIGEMDNSGLDGLEALAKGFVDNPYDPNGGHSEQYTKTYRNEVNDIQTKLAAIETERNRRKTSATTIPIQEVREIAKNLIEQEKYQDAIAKLDDYGRKYPAAKADIDGIMAYVKDSADKNWQAAKSMVQNAHADYMAIGSPATQRREAAERARARLRGVIDNYGIETYVSEAKELLKKFPE